MSRGLGATTHDEADALSATLASLRAQTRPVDRVVVSDNGTDATVKVARSLGADVVCTAGNTGRKAGALNQALAVLGQDVGDRRDLKEGGPPGCGGGI